MHFCVVPYYLRSIVHLPKSSINWVVLFRDYFCRGKKQILCGNCNGAGFIGGIMSTIDD